MRNFNDWLGKMRPSINGYGYYVDFEKVYANVEAIKIELNIMNSLIGSKNIEEDFMVLLNKYPEILRCVPTLLAVRQSEIYAQDSEGAFLYDFDLYSSLYKLDRKIVGNGATSRYKDILYLFCFYSESIIDHINISK